MKKETEEEYWPLLDDCGGDGSAPDGDPLRVLLLVFAAAVIAVLGLSLAGCSRVQYVPVPSVRTDTVWRTAASTDTTVLRDSIHVEIRAASDTVWVTRYKERVRWRDRVRTDTVFASRRDSVPVPYPVEREPTWRERAAVKAFPWLAGVAALLSFVVIRLVKKRVKE